MDSVKVAIADEYPTFRLGLETALRDDAGMEVVVNAGTGHDLLDALECTPADVVLIEPWMRAGDGLSAVSQVLERFPDTTVIVLSR
ncbi:MAG: response regulator, partial [Miltoncostaeaceae bacterium]